MLFRKFKKRLSQQGIALLMVLGSIALITSMIVEFAYNSHINYSMSMNGLDRLKAYYLARSAMGFAVLEVKIEKQIRQQLKGYAQHLSGVVGADPLCRLMPFSTGLLRGLAPAAGGEEAAAAEAGGGEEELSFEGILQAAAAGDFLSFDGDFSVSCVIEDSKMNLNYFTGLNPEEKLPEGWEVNNYESHKRLLESLLATQQYSGFFEDEPELRRQIVNRVADWVDANTMIDESPGFQGGYEEQIYAETDYKAKNGKFSTTSELLLIPGIGDDMYRKLLPNVTVYGDHRINVCLAEDDMVKAFVIRYTNIHPEINPILPDNEETLNNIVEAVRLTCMTPVPDVNEVANAIRTELNLPPETVAPAPKPKKEEKEAEGEKKDDEEESAEEEEAAATEPRKLAEEIVADTRFYSFDLTGSSGDIILNVRAVLDTEDADPKKWKLLYYRIQ